MRFKFERGLCSRDDQSYSGTIFDEIQSLWSFVRWRNSNAKATCGMRRQPPNLIGMMKIELDMKRERTPPVPTPLFSRRSLVIGLI